MLTKLRGFDEYHVQVASQDEDVLVIVSSDADGLPVSALSRTEAHEALEKAKAAAEDFIAAVEGDLEAMG